MNKLFLAGEITKWQEKLVRLSTDKQNLLTDPEVYRCSCIIDRLIVQYMKMDKSVNQYSKENY